MNKQKIGFPYWTKNNVNVYYQLFDDTSTRIWELLKEKTDNISIIMGDKKLTTMNNNLIG
jgi:hypothetical protein